MWKNIVEPEGRRLQYGASALRARYQMLHTYTLRICNTYCLSTATVVAGTRLIACLVFALN